MNKTIILIAFLTVLNYGCCNTQAKNTAPAAADIYTCNVDTDCIAVAKGCCLCDGQKSINKAFAVQIKAQHQQDCAATPCTMQMCYTEIDSACVSGKCVGTLKENQGFSMPTM